MDFLVKLFNEDLVLLLLAEFVALAVVLGLHRRSLTPQSQRRVWITLAVCALLLIVQSYVETDREKIREVISRMVDAVDKGEMSDLTRCIHPDGVGIGAELEGAEFSQDVFVWGTSLGLQQYHVDNAKVGGFQINVTGERAKVRFTVSCELTEGGNRMGFNQSEWEAICVPDEGQWKLRRILQGDIGIVGLKNAPRMDVLSYLKRMSSNAENESQRPPQP